MGHFRSYGQVSDRVASDLKLGSLVVMCDMILGGSIIPADNLAACLQVAFDSGAKRFLIPMSSIGNIPTIPGELFAKFQTSFYADPVDGGFKGLWGWSRNDLTFISLLSLKPGKN